MIDYHFDLRCPECGSELRHGASTTPSVDHDAWQSAAHAVCTVCRCEVSVTVLMAVVEHGSPSLGFLGKPRDEVGARRRAVESAVAG